MIAIEIQKEGKIIGVQEDYVVLFSFFYSCFSTPSIKGVYLKQRCQITGRGPVFPNFCRGRRSLPDEDIESASDELLCFCSFINSY